VSDIGTKWHDTVQSVFAKPELQKKWTLDCLDELESADPTPNKKYMLWIARQYAKGIVRMEDMRSTLKEYLVKFNKLGAKKMLSPEDRDLNSFATPNSLYRKMDRYPNPVKEVDDKGQSHVVYEDDTVRVIVPDDQAAAVYYGRGTRWCTATTVSANYFTQYNSQGHLYILLPKQPKHDGEKYQLHFQSGQFMDEDDESVSASTLLTKRFPKLLEFFNKQESLELEDKVEFADTRTVESIIQQVAELAKDVVMDIMSDWEFSDDTYQDWLQKEGYVDSDGDIDYDRAPSYFEYNPAAEDYYDAVMGKLDIDVDTLREQIRESGRDELEADFNTIPELMAEYMSGPSTWRRRDNEAPTAVINFLEKKVIVNKQKDGTWKAEIVKPRAKP
jgi:hypothetical protein